MSDATIEALKARIAELTQQRDEWQRLCCRATDLLKNMVPKSIKEVTDDESETAVNS